MHKKNTDHGPVIIAFIFSIFSIGGILVAICIIV